MNAVKFPSHQHALNLVDLLPGEEDQEEEDQEEENQEEEDQEEEDQEEDDQEEEDQEEEDDQKKKKKKEESRVCGLCGKRVKGPRYECSVCNFTAHPRCVKNPPSLVIFRKIHEHTLTLLPRHVSFTCNACGLSGEKSPYVCLSCSFMIHRGCLYTPRAIRTNRHDHRISHTFFLGPGEWSCGICRTMVDGKYGAYSCAKEDCSYAFHSRCATRRDVWDGIELEGVPEELEGVPEELEEIEGGSEPLIGSFSHPHLLWLIENEDIRDAFCYGCSSPVDSNPFYRCDECDFFLHKRCANLPQNIYSILHAHPLRLCADDGVFKCRVCDLPSSGFRYSCLKCRSDNKEYHIDVRCSSVTEPFDNHLHHHPLFSTGMTNCICNVCNSLSPGNFLSCIECDFHLCFACATLPDKVMYKYDEHPLSYTVGNSDPYSCDICENNMEECKHLYKCSDCGPVVHTECILGSFRNMRPGYRIITDDGEKCELILNDWTSLLRCRQCHKDCHEPLLLMITPTTTDDTAYLCCSCVSPTLFGSKSPLN